MANITAMEKPRVSPINDPKVRSMVFQTVLLIVLAWLVYEAVINTRANMEKSGLASGFGFWDRAAGFDINQTLISYSAVATYGRAFWVGLVNTLVVAAIGVVFATFLGFFIGVARLSSNFIVAKLAMIYVESIRNVPLLLQLLFWYNALLKPLPAPRQSISLFNTIYLNNRGIITPTPIWGDGATWIFVALVVGVVASIGYTVVAHRKQKETGKQSPIFLTSLALIVGLPLLAYFIMGRPLSFTVPELKGFNFQGGSQIYPEFVALLLGLVIYTAAFIAEIVRAGIMAVNKGQSEASHALGLRPGPTLKLVVIPQALRVIIPPLTSQYLNLTKNSSLAVFIGYPDLVQVFAGTVLNQTGQAVEVMAITMAVYLVISLAVSFAMNWYNAKKSLVER